MQKLLVSFLMVVPAIGFTQTAETVVNNQENALPQAVDQASQIQKGNEDTPSIRFGQQIRANVLFQNTDQLRRFIHDKTPYAGFRFDIEHKIFALQKNGPAELAGLKIGDTIVQVNGQHVETWSIDEIQSLNNGSNPVTFTVKREGEANALSFNVEKKPFQLSDKVVKQIDRDLQKIGSKALKIQHQLESLDTRTSHPDTIKKARQELSQLEGRYSEIKDRIDCIVGFKDCGDNISHPITIKLAD